MEKKIWKKKHTQKNQKEENDEIFYFYWGWMEKFMKKFYSSKEMFPFKNFILWKRLLDSKLVENHNILENFGMATIAKACLTLETAI
jgi:hypothetical protein